MKKKMAIGILPFRSLKPFVYVDFATFGCGSTKQLSTSLVGSSLSYEEAVIIFSFLRKAFYPRSFSKCLKDFSISRKITD